MFGKLKHREKSAMSPDGVIKQGYRNNIFNFADKLDRSYLGNCMIY